MLVLLAFVGFGVMWGAWDVLLPELSRELAPSTGALGAALSIGILGSIPAMVVGGRLSDRFGPRQVSLIAGLAFAASLAAVAAVSSYALLVALLFVTFATSGIFDVGINAAGIDLERQSGRPRLPLLHAGFSGGGAAGAILAATELSAGLPYRSMYVMAAVIVAALILAWTAARSAPHQRLEAEAGERMLFRSPILLALGFATAMAFFAEGSMESWSAIYLRVSLGLPLLLGSSGPALFHAAMCAGRLMAAGVVGGLGRRATLGIAGVAVAIGMGVALVTTAAPAVLIGMAIVGLSLAAVAPVTLSLAGDAGGRRSGQASAVITTIGYAGFLLGPGLVGGIAQATNLRLALTSVIVAGLAVIVVAGRIHPSQPRKAA